jgi:platelet-activating factor acetylhydrolase IB subunit alpha|eukprot:g2569.t1
MVLTEKQRKDLNAGILGYLKESGEAFAGVVDVFAEAAGIDVNTDKPARTAILEKKWTSVVRLQRKLMDAEGKLAQALEDLEAAGKGGLAAASGDGSSGGKIVEALPRSPAAATLSGHRGTVMSVAFHPVFNLMASASEDATIKVWDYETGEFERTLKGHTNIVNCCVFNSSGETLASCSADLSIKIWDFKDTFSCTRTLMGHDHNVSALAFVPSGEQLLSCSRDSTVRVWEVRTGYCVKTIDAHDDWVRSIAISEDGKFFATASSDKSAAVWSIDSTSGSSPQPIARLQEHEHVVECVTFLNATGNRVVARRGRGNIKSASNGSNGDKEKNTVPPAQGSNTSLSACHVATGSRDRTVRVWNVLTSACLMVFSDHENWVRQVKIHPCGKFLVSVAEDRTMRVFDLKDGRATKTINDAHEHFVTCLCIHSNGHIIATGSVDKSIKKWLCRG